MLLKKKEIFTNSLKTTVFLVILEILWNIWIERDCQKCFSTKILKKLRKEKTIVKYFFNKAKSIDKRKRRFLTSGNSFKKLMKNILKEFFKNCVENIE